MPRKSKDVDMEKSKETSSQSSSNVSRNRCEQSDLSNQLAIVSTEKVSGEEQKEVREDAVRKELVAKGVSAEGDSSSEKCASTLKDEIIGYVESVSPLKRNRKGTMDYSDVSFQLQGGKKQRAVCFSKSKRQLLLERQKNKTAVKLAKLNFSKNSDTCFINDMTYISSPRPEEYSFQFEEKNACDTYRSLKETLEKSDPMEVVNIKGKVVALGELQTVSQKELKMIEALISDGEKCATLVLWENDTLKVANGKAYNFEKVRIRERNDEKVFNTTKETVITENNERFLVSVTDNVDVQLQTVSKSIIVPKIDFIEQYSASKACVNCNKHIMQNSSNYTIKCDFCHHIMRQDACRLAVVVKIVVTDTSIPLKANTIHLAIFDNVLIRVLGTEGIFDEDFVCSSLLKLKNMKITYNIKRSVVSNIEKL